MTTNYCFHQFWFIIIYNFLYHGGICMHVVLEHQIFEGYWLMSKQNCNDIEEEMLQWKQAKNRPNVRDDDQKVFPQTNSTVEFFIVQSITLTPPSIRWFQIGASLDVLIKSSTVNTGRFYLYRARITSLLLKQQFDCQNDSEASLLHENK